MVSVGNVPPLGMKGYPLPLIAFKFFSRANIEQQECCKSKTRLKFMKLGMLSWSGINMPW
ncbi:hypothetical protein T12_1316 [Trichinella patagoniensis]|uniref:Uncharacterized protein n=1 Tax=Trichinella patagoniensis TaxID=990121 RepID=A0A0V0YX99_9BILA|nr:hypothetical protein T12_1316 [Trichinella patagoniensis]